MKKIIVAILAVCSLAGLSGCANVNAQSDHADVVSQADTAQPGKLTVTPSASSDLLSCIGEEAAKDAALAHSGLHASQVTYIKAALENDDGCTVYDIVFYKGNTEYDYEIDAYTGAVVSCDFDIENANAVSVQSDDSAHIPMEEAKSIALKAAGLAASAVTFTQTSLEYDDGAAAYQMTFVSQDMEYEVKIHAGSGTVLEYDKEYLYD